jgi:hypothetical protein
VGLFGDLAFVLKLRRGTETVKGMFLLQQLNRHHTVVTQMFTLMDNIRVFDPEKSKNIKDLLVFALDITLLIGIFDTNEQFFTALLCDNVVEKGNTQVSDVHITGWTWGKT